ncbi:UNVERIFIED_CONTAM: hypothetical protein FKN15_008990 [Acipenser sinensis]
MAQYDPSSLPPNAEEKDFIQAYENVREKYKGSLNHIYRVQILYSKWQRDWSD